MLYEHVKFIYVSETSSHLRVSMSFMTFEEKKKVFYLIKMSCAKHLHQNAIKSNELLFVVVEKLSHNDSYRDL